MYILDDGSNDGKCSIGGVAGYAFNILLDQTRHLAKYILYISSILLITLIKLHNLYSCTLQAFPNVGTYDNKTGRYTEALGSIQDGNSDILAMFAYHPLIDPKGKYFDYTPTLFEDRMMMLSAFKQIAIENETDEDSSLLNMFTSVPSDLWWGALIGFVTFVATLNDGYRVLGVSQK